MGRFSRRFHDDAEICNRPINTRTTRTMLINFQGYNPTTQTVEFNSDDLQEFRKIVNDQFMTYVRYGTFDPYFPSAMDKTILDFCGRFGVDGLNKTARIAFFEALTSAV